jgi:hypothetical protein
VSRARRAHLGVEFLEARCLLSDFTLGPLVQVSHYDPFAGCTSDRGQEGILYPGSELEPRLAIDPTNPDHLVGNWQQDRWSNGGSRGLVAGVSLNGGLGWEEVVIPGLSRCSGGSFFRASDPWISFAPNGDVYSISQSADGMLVSKSTDGGFTWGVPIAFVGGFFYDKGTITADPTDDRYVYAVWNGDGGQNFSRSTDGGQSWETPRAIVPSVIDSHVVVLPDGTLVDVFSDGSGLDLKQSTDKGETWGPQFQISTLQGIDVRDPATGQLVRSGDNGNVFDVAVDPNSGNLYSVWIDARFNQRQHNSIALTMSTDGGLTWSAPVQVNQTPTKIPPGNQQAFLPSVQVSQDGTIAVTYYDFRFNGSKPGLLTDYWFVHGQPNDSGGIDWGEELRLTDESFDMRTAPNAGGLFVGDYEGVGAAGNSFVAFFAHPHPGDWDSIFSRRMDPAGAAPAGGDGLSFETAWFLTLASARWSDFRAVTTIPPPARSVTAAAMREESTAAIEAAGSRIITGISFLQRSSLYQRENQGDWSFAVADDLFFDGGHIGKVAT